jgi:hypothetical protein
MNRGGEIFKIEGEDFKNSFETETLSGLVDASLGLRVRPFVEGLLAVSHPEDPPLTSLAEGRGVEVLSAFRTLQKSTKYCFLHMFRDSFLIKTRYERQKHALPA